MSFFDYFMATDWGLAYRFLAKGHMPLIVQILAVNTLFLTIYVVRNATAKNRLRHSTVLSIQGILIAANLVVILQDTVWPYVQKYTVL